MANLGFWPTLVLTVLAVWRTTHLLAAEDGPGNIVLKLRIALGNGFFGKLMDCFYCLSIWVAAPFAFFIATEPLFWVITWLALSGGACLLERVGQVPDTHSSPD